jgi:hypothetical protein
MIISRIVLAGDRDAGQVAAVAEAADELAEAGEGGGVGLVGEVDAAGGPDADGVSPGATQSDVDQ